MFEAAATAAQGGPTQIVVRGTAGDQTAVEMTRLLVRGPLGSADTSFNTTGSTTPSFRTQGVAVQPDGAVIVTGSSNSDVAVQRFTAGGTADPTFGSSVQQPDGKLLVAGKFRSAISSNTIAYIVRILATGALDPTFGTNGRVDFTGVQSSGSNQIHGLSLTSDGRILVAGTTPDPGVDNADGYVMRLQANGMRDTTLPDGSIRPGQFAHARATSPTP